MAGAQILVSGGKVSRDIIQKLKAVAAGRARPAFARALNRGGDMGRTQLFISLNKTTGISRQQIKSVIKTTPASGARLVYTLTGSGSETNVSLFKAKQGKRGVSAAPWGKRRVFKSSFVVPAYGGRTYVRTSDKRGPLHALYGPNIGREMGKEPNMTAWERGSLNGVERRLLHEVGRLL